MAALPNVEFPTITVSATLAGANPETMAISAAQILEREFSTIAGIDTITSTSTLGSTQITLQFALDRKIDAAAADVQAAIARTQRRLPQEMTDVPSYRKVNPAASPVLMLSLSSPLQPLSALNEIAESQLQPRISTLPGVAQVQIFGSQKYAVRIQIDPNQLAMRGMFVEQDHPRLGKLRLPNLPFRFSDLDLGTPAVAPELGQHNAEIAAELGFSETEIAGMQAEGAFSG